MRDVILKILAEELSPARAEAVASKIVAALGGAALTAPAVRKALDVLVGALGSDPPASAGRRASRGRAAGRKAKAKAKAKTPRAPRTKATGLGLRKGGKNLVKARAQLRWARQRAKDGDPKEGDAELIERLEKLLHPKAADGLNGAART